MKSIQKNEKEPQRSHAAHSCLLQGLTLSRRAAQRLDVLGELFQFAYLCHRGFHTFADSFREIL